MLFFSFLQAVLVVVVHISWAENALSPSGVKRNDESVSAFAVAMVTNLRTIFNEVSGDKGGILPHDNVYPPQPK